MGATPEMLLERARIVSAIRAFFVERMFTEVETPVRIPCAAPEAHIEPVESCGWVLQTSPELCMKRLLSGGNGRIFQLARCFRGEERGRLHLPEFTLLEWYRSGVDYFALMDDCEDLFARVAAAAGTGAVVRFGGVEADLSEPWERFTVEECFRRHSPKPLEEVLEDGSFDEVWVESVEPRLGVGRPAFVLDWPESMAALARLKDAGGSRRVAERVELYICGVELANGFSELADPQEQRARFEAELAVRRDRGAAPGPLPERFLKDLASMGEAAGMALGVDRLVMLLSGASSVGEVVAFTPEEL